MVERLWETESDITEWEPSHADSSIFSPMTGQRSLHKELILIYLHLHIPPRCSWFVPADAGTSTRPRARPHKRCWTKSRPGLSAHSRLWEALRQRYTHTHTMKVQKNSIHLPFTWSRHTSAHKCSMCWSVDQVMGIWVHYRNADTDTTECWCLWGNS